MNISGDNMDSTIMVATAGQGILRSNDAGSTWHRLGLGEAIEFDGVVRALAVDPMRPARVYAGADAGLCISDDDFKLIRKALKSSPLTRSHLPDTFSVHRSFNFCLWNKVG